jgi:hypothetical protein
MVFWLRRLLYWKVCYKEWLMRLKHSPLWEHMHHTTFEVFGIYVRLACFRGACLMVDGRKLLIHWRWKRMYCRWLQLSFHLYSLICTCHTHTHTHSFLVVEGFAWAALCPFELQNDKHCSLPITGVSRTSSSGHGLSSVLKFNHCEDGALQQPWNLYLEQKPAYNLTPSIPAYFTIDVWCDIVSDVFITPHVVLGCFTGLLPAFLGEMWADLVKYVVQWIQRTIWYMYDTTSPCFSMFALECNLYVVTDRSRWTCSMATTHTRHSPTRCLPLRHPKSLVYAWPVEHEGQLLP